MPEISPKINDLVMDEALAYEQAALEDQGYDISAELGIRDQASTMIEAHGQRYSVAAALRDCKPFADTIKTMSESLVQAGVDETVRSTVLTGTISKMAADTKSAPVPDVVKVSHEQVVSSNDKLKKN